MTGTTAFVRNTRQRRAIRAALESSPHPLTPTQIFAIAHPSLPKLHLVTVYRTLHTMEQDGQISSVLVPGEPPHYELAREHHHHFFCRLCRRIFNLPCDGHSCASPRAPLFQIDEVRIVTLGRCLECAAA